MQMCEYVIRIRRGKGTLPDDANDVIEHVVRTVPNGGRDEYERQRAQYPVRRSGWRECYWVIVAPSKLGPQCSGLIFPDPRAGGWLGYDDEEAAGVNGYVCVHRLGELVSMLMDEGHADRGAFSTWQYRKSDEASKQGHDWQSGWWREVGYEDHYPDHDYQ